MSQSWSIEEYKRYIRTGNRPSNNNTLRSADVESNSINEQAGKIQVDKVHEKYRINVNRHSAKLCDPDNIASKWAVDALEQAGVFPEDSPEYIESVNYQQTKCKRSEEKTVITVYKI